MANSSGYKPRGSIDKQFNRRVKIGHIEFVAEKM